MAARVGCKNSHNIKPRGLRHWFATHMLWQGTNLKQIQAALGHSQAQTTFIYLHSDEHDAEAMVEFADFDPNFQADVLVKPSAKPATVLPETPWRQRVALTSKTSIRR